MEVIVITLVVVDDVEGLVDEVVVIEVRVVDEELIEEVLVVEENKLNVVVV